MSIQVMQAVWQHSNADGRARLVLLAIADHQGEIGAWPSIATIAKMVNASERSVQRDIQYLQNIGELSVEVQNAPTRNQYKSNLYWVTLPSTSPVTSGVTESTAGVTETQSGVTDSASGVTAVGVQTLKEPLKNPNRIKTQELFDEFWNAYPRKQDKAKAFRAFKSAINRATFEDILAGVIAYRNDSKRDPDFTKFPATWLNNDGWEYAAGAGVSPHTERNERERQRSQDYLAELKAQEALAAPPPKCEHGLTIARCKQCITSIS